MSHDARVRIAWIGTQSQGQSQGSDVFGLTLNDFSFDDGTWPQVLPSGLVGVSDVDPSAGIGEPVGQSVPRSVAWMERQFQADEHAAILYLPTPTTELDPLRTVACPYVPDLCVARSNLLGQP